VKINATVMEFEQVLLYLLNACFYVWVTQADVCVDAF
jgi:hypothetical protein